MKKILFVCHGNICRSTMAEFVMKEYVHQNNLEDQFIIDSKATSDEETGNPIHYGTRQILEQNHIPYTEHIATKMTKEDYANYDLIIGMDDSNIVNIMRIVGSDPENKVRKLAQEEVVDPWYTGNFESTYTDITAGCSKLLEELK